MRVKHFDNIDWLQYINLMEPLPSLEEACKRYENNLKSIISKNLKYKKTPVLMLSGGVDSMMLGTILKKHFGLKHSITVACIKDTHDIIQAQKSAKMLGISNEVVEVTYDELIHNFPLAQGKDITTTFSLIYYLMFTLGLSKANVHNVDLINGDGADTLLGSINPFMYVDRPHIMKKYKCTDEEANTAIKMRFYGKALDPTTRKGKGAGHLFVQAAKENNCNPVMAYKDRKVLEWVNRLPYDFANGARYPKNKRLHKEFIKYMGYDNPHERTVMQVGTGIYDKFKEHLITTYKVNRPNQAVNQIVNSTSTLPI
jgi:asparagine synthetase B (glutamine-hydrolysing)